MLIKAELLKQEIPARLTENAALCCPWGENGLAVHFYDGDGRIVGSWWSDGKKQRQISVQHTDVDDRAVPVPGV